VSGGWALHSHVPALAALDGFGLAAVSTSRLATAERTARQLGVPHHYATPAALAADPDVDLVTVAVKVPDHEPAVRAAIAAGKDVYCEWPLATNTDAAARLCGLAAAAGVSTVIGLQARSAPALRFARDLVAGGDLGRILSVHANSCGFANGGPVLAEDRAWAADDQSGLSALTVRAAHTLDAALFCAGPALAVSAELLVATPTALIGDTGRTVPRTAPDQVLVQGRLNGGGSLSGRFLLGVRGDEAPLLTFCGTEGTLTVTGEGEEPQIQFSPLRLRVARRGSPFGDLAVPGSYRRAPRDLPPGPAAAVAEHYLSLAEAPGFADAVTLHRLLDTIRLAAATGQRQPVG
jgi:predicted dehydrogenase